MKQIGTLLFLNEMLKTSNFAVGIEGAAYAIGHNNTKNATGIISHFCLGSDLS